MPIEVFYEKIRQSLFLLRLVESSQAPKEIKTEARKNFIINCVTALENFLKDMIVGLVDIGDLNVEDLLKGEKISLYDAYSLFVNKKVSLGELIAVNFSWQNLERINQVVSKLTGENFLDKLENVQVKDEEGKPKFTLNNKFPDWRNKLFELFRLRHQFVHQVSFNDRLGLQRVKNLCKVLTAFVEAAEQYLFEFIPLEE